MSEPNEKVITKNCHHYYCSQRECASNFCKQIHYVKVCRSKVLQWQERNYEQERHRC